MIKICTPLHRGATVPGVVEKLLNSDIKCFHKQLSGSLLFDIRNRLVNNGVSDENPPIIPDDWDYVLMVDSDIIAEKRHVEQLLHRDCDVVGAAYQMRDADRLYTAGIFGKDLSTKFHIGFDKTGLTRVSWVGMGLTLIKRKVFENSEFPWFRHEFVTIGNRKNQTIEDVGFCINAGRHGFKIFLDCDCVVEHVI